MSDVDMDTTSLVGMVVSMLIIVVCVIAWCAYVYPVLVRVYWYCADALYRALYHNVMRTRR